MHSNADQRTLFFQAIVYDLQIVFQLVYGLHGLHRWSWSICARKWY